MPLNDTPPRLKAPPGTTDTHMHIYDSRYPTAGTAAFTPPDALVPAYLKAWVFAGGKQQPGLVKRRAAESALWSMP